MKFLKGMSRYLGSVYLMVFSIYTGILSLVVLNRFDFFDFPLFETISISTFVVFLSVVLTGKFKMNLNWEKLILVSAISAILFYSASLSTILNIDRSRSFFILGWSNSNLIVIQENNLDFDLVKSEEKNSYKEILRRINEQESRGLLEQRGNRVVLTGKGKVYFRIAETLARIFNLRGWDANKY